MSTGFRDDKSVFGIPESSGQSAPSPADLARSASSVPFPSDAASKSRRSRVRRKHPVSDAPIENSQAVLAGNRQDDATAGRAGSLSEASSNLFVEDKGMRRRKTAIIAVLLVVLVVVSLFVDAGFGRFFNPVEVFSCYGTWFHQAFATLFAPAEVMSPSDLLASHWDYYRIVSRAGITVMTVICGGVLAVAGSLYQIVFRNPIASPSMLGVSSAIQLGDVILVLLFGTAAASHLGERYLICYACVVVVMVLLFAFTRFMTGKGRSLNVVNLLLTAMILTQIIGVIITYYTTFVFTWEMWEVFENLSEALTVDLSLFGWVALIVTCVIGLTPVLILRFRLNGLSFDDSEMKLLGINAQRLRIIALICGTVLLMGVQVQMGTVAMLALVVPHVSRMVFGAEFRKQFLGNALMGAALLVLCSSIVGFIPLLGPILPVSVVLNFVVLPFFVWMLATQQRGWE